MLKDRKAICKIISDILCNVRQTHAATNRLEEYVERERARAIGWTHGDACIDVDNGRDPREKDVADMFARAQDDLAGGE